MHNLKHLIILFIFAQSFLVFGMQNESILTKEMLEQIREFRVPAYKKLNEEQKLSLTPENYIQNQMKGNETLQVMASLMVDLAKEKYNLTNIEQLKKEFTEEMIKMRRAVLDEQPIAVVDEFTARARAAQRLTPQEKNSLQITEYSANKEKAIKVLIIMAEYTLDELCKAELINKETLDTQSWIDQFVDRKIKELDNVYE